jgi:protein-S-isoprenylcysteine O-methyltransferase Ste14
MVVAHFVVPVVQLIRFPLSLLGLIGVGLGILLNLLADRSLAAHGTTVKPFERSTFLVTTGVFAISRNPMYLGMMLLGIGVAILLGSAMPFVLVAFLFVLLDRTFVRPEERGLAETFGDGWCSYCGRVRRWV